MAVGAAVGDGERDAEGDADGEADGDREGEGEAEAEGDADGEAEGETEGEADGPTTGSGGGGTVPYEADASADSPKLLIADTVIEFTWVETIPVFTQFVPVVAAQAITLFT